MESLGADDTLEHYFGKKVVDRITNFEGIVTAMCFYIEDVPLARVESAISKLSNTGDEKWINVARLSIL